MIIFMGVAGSGKSVQGRYLADKLSLPWLSTGEFLRMLVSGEKREAMLSGKLLEDHEIIELVRKIFAMVDTKQQFILDGFPRTLAQADWILNQAKHKQMHITAVIHIRVSKSVVLERLHGRGRPDDNDESIAERFHEYDNTIKPILADFKQNNIKIFDIDGEQDIAMVHDDVLEAVNLAISEQEKKS
ncbi:nucleoside monophosphate kinase [Candidatus Saccharibacteria bacterium]|jgi:adenylate kinase|nr:nucleoside monophosphate kinase [Candidatus Saccharibacteria bacterium]